MTRQSKYLLAIILFTVLLLRIPTLYTAIMDIDESQYGEFAVKVVDGMPPYASSIGEKPPLMYYYYIWIFKAFGKNNYYMVHAITILWAMISAYVIFLIGRLRYNESVGLIAALFYAVFSTTHEPKIISTNGETLMTLPLVLGVYFFSLYEQRVHDNGKSKTVYWIGLAGIFTGLGFLFRYQAGMQIGFLGIYFLLRYVIFDPKVKSAVTYVKRLSQGAFLGISFLVPFGIACWIMDSLGVFDKFIYWNFTFNFKYIGAGANLLPSFNGLIRLPIFLVFTLPVWFYAVKGIIKGISLLIRDIKGKQVERISDSYLFLILWLIFSVIPVFLGSRFYSHYFIQTFPPLFLLGAVGAFYTFEKIKEKTGQKMGYTLISRKLTLVIAFYAILFMLPRVDADYTKVLMKKISPGDAKLGVYPEQKAVGEYIKRRTQRTDTIFIWGFATPIYVYADRACGSRFSWTDFLSGRIPGLPTGGTYKKANTDSYIVSGAWEDFCDDLIRYQPVYFVDTSTGDYHEYGKYPIHRKYRGFDLGKFVDRFYREETRIYGMTLYRLKKAIQRPCQ